MPSKDDDQRESWGFDAVLGAVARSVRVTQKVASGGEKVAHAIGSTAIGKAATGTARRVIDPLARDGAEVRQQMGEDLPPMAKDLAARVTPAVIETIDPDALIGTIDLDQLLEHIDLNRLMGHIDLDQLMARIDLNALMGRIDLDALMGQIDLNALMERVDVDALVGRTEIGSLVAKSTSGMASGALDVVRRQGVGLDNFVARWVDRILRRDPEQREAGPPLLVPTFAGELSAAPGARSGTASESAA
jgi:hypothetical protein